MGLSSSGEIPAAAGDDAIAKATTSGENFPRNALARYFSRLIFTPGICAAEAITI